MQFPAESVKVVQSSDHERVLQNRFYGYVSVVLIQKKRQVRPNGLPYPDNSADHWRIFKIVVDVRDAHIVMSLVHVSDPKITHVRVIAGNNERQLYYCRVDPERRSDKKHHLKLSVLRHKIQKSCRLRSRHTRSLKPVSQRIIIRRFLSRTDRPFSVWQTIRSLGRSKPGLEEDTQEFSEHPEYVP